LKTLLRIIVLGYTINKYIGTLRENVRKKIRKVRNPNIQGEILKVQKKKRNVSLTRNVVVHNTKVCVNGRNPNICCNPSLKEAADRRCGSKEDDALYAAAASTWQAASFSADLGGYENGMGQADPAPLIVEGALYSHKDLNTKKEGAY
jgi:hypothetical protein